MEEKLQKSKKTHTHTKPTKKSKNMVESLLFDFKKAL